MPRRRTPRAPEEALAIARALRRRYISAEVETTAKRALSRLGLDPRTMLSGLMAGAQKPPPADAAAPNPAPTDPNPADAIQAIRAAAKSATPIGQSGSKLMDLVRAREGIALRQADQPTASLDQSLEAEARAILDDIRKRYRRQ
ncbi:MAG: hypothetical protein EAZ99_09885 [Alphaproteobacteria bacterium]|nr:hypothetical protein [Alphaproteobacteria bacterium]TAD89445.1 MAG: hypothetical protein EAZ99_09885 [Alphaproteobacteria bacterium]